jgi:MSHA biogenesis protein MshO
MAYPRKSSGFTLIEMIIAMTITGILAGIISVFIAKPMQGYVDTVRRATLTDVADLSLKRLSLDLRTAVPNTVRLRSNSSSSVSDCSAPTTYTSCYLEFIPARTGGRYCADTDSGCTNQLSFGTGGSTKFDVLGPQHDATTAESVVIYNTGQSELNAYAAPPNNRRAISEGVETSATAINMSSTLTYVSPSSRFQIVPSTGPVSFACVNVTDGTNGGGNLYRYTGYGYNATQANAGLGTGALLADNISNCQITYSAVNARNGIVSIQLTLKMNDESVTLLHQIHVDNLP